MNALTKTRQTSSKRSVGLSLLLAILTALALAVGTLLIARANPAPAATTLQNGGFEAGNFSGWTVVNEEGGWGDWYVYSADTGPWSSFPPPEGTYAALSSQPGPGSHILYQDVTLAAGAKHELSFTTFYENYGGGFYTPDSLSYNTWPNQQYRVDIMNPNAPVDSVAPEDVLATVFSTKADAPWYMEPTPITFDLSPFAGSTVRLRFAEVDNQGNFFAGVDGVKVTSTSVDQTPPVITAADITKEATGPNGAAVEFKATATDDVDGVLPDSALTYNTDSGQPVASGDTFPLGTTTVNVTATDAHGNTATGHFDVTVVDTTPPVISGVPADMNVAATGLSKATVDYAAPTATDLVDGGVSVQGAPASGSEFGVGTTTVNFTATDGHGNTAQASFKVTVSYASKGFFAPVDNLPTPNKAKAGSAIPVKFSLGGYQGGVYPQDPLDPSIFETGYPRSVAIQSLDVTEADAIEQTVTAGQSGLSYDQNTDQYTYVWKTDKTWAGKYRQLVIVFRDGQTYRANFWFTK